MLTDFDIKTGTSPIENIEEISANFILEIKEDKYLLSGLIGNMRIKSEFEKCFENCKNTFYKYKNINNKINEISFKKNNSLICNYEPESNINISVYLVSWIIVFAQLGEVLAFNVANVSREESENFWVRKLHLHLNKTKSLKSNHNDKLKVKIVKNRKIKKTDGIWHTFEMVGDDELSLVDVRAKTALKVRRITNV
ncbi:AvrD family protein [Fructilactobacillus florum]|uniref:AvrD family protein n=1 Tax=Fructilactobacillus florum TaxID=640331 RepID=UPI0006D25E07|nr:AvrD family protein [Fructilactobacillus florum]